MTTFMAHSGHEFWPDNVTLLDGKHTDSARLPDSAQVTDSYLLTLASGGKPATFDWQLVTDAVNGAQALQLIN
ncbi:hypothetical protein [Terriglobus albidus]|uniref:hypothetical protein n=1 Tax=Terriglobus albidus TaxID=1592106 RepID=UPI001C9C2855|nr:hypothetical protein [Terriglobus albidus]